MLYIDSADDFVIKSKLYRLCSKISILKKMKLLSVCFPSSIVYGFGCFLKDLFLCWARDSELATKFYAANGFIVQNGLACHHISIIFEI